MPNKYEVKGTPKKKKNTAFKDEISIPRRLSVPRVAQPPAFSKGPKRLQAALSERNTEYTAGPEGKQPTSGPLAPPLATRPEWYVYWALTTRLGKVPGVDFNFRGEVQMASSLATAAQLDFTMVDGSGIALEIQGTHWHYELGTSKITEDQYRKAQLSASGWKVIFLDEARIVIDPSGRAVEWLVREALEGREHTYEINPYMIK